MSWATLALALLRAFPEVIALLKSLDMRARSSADQRIGYDNAVREGLVRASEAAASDAAADIETTERHTAAPNDDSAFDQEFKRP